MKVHRVHQGEIFVQQKRHAPAELSQVLEQIISTEMPKQHSDFFANLLYLPLGTIDSEDKVWGTILTCPKVSVIDSLHLDVSAKLPSDDPFVTALQSKPKVPYFSGVGVDFTNRRRNKLAGLVKQWSYSNGTLQMILETNENMGNCPKYITVRQLVPKTRVADQAEYMAELNSYAQQILKTASTVFLVTRHLDPNGVDWSDLGMNHRGGKPGFVRYSRNNEGSFLVLPDYSGNRFYQSLGNIESDGIASIIIPDFTTGDLVHVTGSSKNLFDEEADKIMPRTSLVTLIKIEKVALLRKSMNLELVGQEVMSPYNPPLRYLASETTENYLPTLDNVKIIDVATNSKLIKTFVFQLNQPAELVPGGFGIFDFSSVFQKEYRHMNNANPASLNDDLVRTWTISNISSDRLRVSITVKKQGAISSVLHSVSVDQLQGWNVKLRGFGGEFTCFGDDKRKKMLYLAGGVGITPFLAMHQHFQKDKSDYDINLLYACRDDEKYIVGEFFNDPKCSVQLFDSGYKGSENIIKRRINQSDLQSIQDLHERDVYICGPQAFMEKMKDDLKQLGHERVFYENFTF